MLFEKTNPGKWVTWTFDALQEDEAAEDAPPPLPTPLDFVMVILPVIRRFPDAYQAMLDAISLHWPYLGAAASRPG